MGKKKADSLGDRMRQNYGGIVRKKLVELSDIQVLQREMECVKRKSATNCTDCINCDLLMTDERILTAYKNAIVALQNAHGVTVQEWISVDDRLPEKTERYLTSSQGFNGEIRVFDLWFERGEWYIDEDDEKFDYEVTHWMHLPPAPKGE